MWTKKCIELLHVCATDASERVLVQTERLLMPSLCLWSLSAHKLDTLLVAHLLDKLESHLISANKQRSLPHQRNAHTYIRLLARATPFVFAYVLTSFRTVSGNSEPTDADQQQHSTYIDSLPNDERLAKLNAFYHALHNELEQQQQQQDDANGHDELCKVDTILDDCVPLTRRYLSLIESSDMTQGTWSTERVDAAFGWLGDVLMRRLIQLSAHIGACSPLCAPFVDLFRRLTTLFAVDDELIASKMSLICQRLLDVPVGDSSSSNGSDEMAASMKVNASLFKSTLVVYFVGIQTTLVDVRVSCDALNSLTAKNNNASNNAAADSDHSFTESFMVGHTFCSYYSLMVTKKSQKAIFQPNWKYCNF